MRRSSGCGAVRCSDRFLARSLPNHGLLHAAPHEHEHALRIHSHGTPTASRQPPRVYVCDNNNKQHKQQKNTRCVGFRRRARSWPVESSMGILFGAETTCASLGGVIQIDPSTARLPSRSCLQCARNRRDQVGYRPMGTGEKVGCSSLLHCPSWPHFRGRNPGTTI